MKLNGTLKRKIILSAIIPTIIFTIIFAGCSAEKTGNKVLGDGIHSVNITMEGGTGKASINSPAEVCVEGGNAYATLIWSSKNYDYMIVNGEKYINESEGGYSTFTVPIPNPLEDLTVIGDTTAMSTPHEIEYTLHFEKNE